jgi:hypothetical protein
VVWVIKVCPETIEELDKGKELVEISTLAE